MEINVEGIVLFSLVVGDQVVVVVVVVVIVGDTGLVISRPLGVAPGLETEDTGFRSSWGTRRSELGAREHEMRLNKCSQMQTEIWLWHCECNSKNKKGDDNASRSKNNADAYRSNNNVPPMNKWQEIMN